MKFGMLCVVYGSMPRTHIHLPFVADVKKKIITYDRWRDLPTLCVHFSNRGRLAPVTRVTYGVCTFGEKLKKKRKPSILTAVLNPQRTVYF